MPDDFDNPWAPGGSKYPDYLAEGQERWLPSSTQGKPAADDSGRTVYLKNNSTHTVYYKPEHTGQALPVPPGGSVYETVDGVATHKYCSQVYKIPGNDDISLTTTIDENGDVDPDYYGIGDLMALVGGGWKDRAWLKERHEQVDKDGKPQPDFGWNALFEKSLNICR